MTRVVLGAFLAIATPFCGAAQQSQAQQPQAPIAQQRKQPPANTGNSTQQGQTEEEPPEEDESLAPEKYVLNPLESERNVRVGNYYWHKGKYRAAVSRYQRATYFNPSSPEAFMKLGEAQEKLKNGDAARSAFQKVVQLAPDSKFGHEAKKKLNKS